MILQDCKQIDKDCSLVKIDYPFLLKNVKRIEKVGNSDYIFENCYGEKWSFQWPLRDNYLIATFYLFIYLFSGYC